MTSVIKRTIQLEPRLVRYHGLRGSESIQMSDVTEIRWTEVKGTRILFICAEKRSIRMTDQKVSKSDLQAIAEYVYQCDKAVGNRTLRRPIAQKSFSDFAKKL